MLVQLGLRHGRVVALLVESVDGRCIDAKDFGSLELQRRCQLAAINREIFPQQRPLLYALSPRCRLLIDGVDAFLYGDQHLMHAGEQPPISYDTVVGNNTGSHIGRTGSYFSVGQII